MALDFLGMIFEVLRVENLASQYSAPLDQFLYTVFFPSIFIILLVYIIANRFAEWGKMWKMLIGVAIYVFIIVFPPNETYSLYSMFAPLGQIWFILIIILVGIYAIFKTFFPSSGGGGAGGAQSKSGLGSQLTGRLWKQATGQVSDLQNMVRSELDALKAIAEKMKHAKTEMDYRDAYQAYPALNDEVVKHLQMLREQIAVAGGLKLDTGGRNSFNNLMKEYQQISRDILKFQKKKR
jgi:hypothetical protein